MSNIAAGNKKPVTNWTHMRERRIPDASQKLLHNEAFDLD